MLVKEHNLLLRYLLGDLPPRDREHLEHEYFVNDEMWQALRDVEDDLIDSYVRGTLSQEQRRKFESYFLALPNKRRRVELAQMLIDPAVRANFAEVETEAELEPGVPKRPRSLGWFSWTPTTAFKVASGVAAFSIIALCVFLAVRNADLQAKLGSLRSQQTDLQHQVLNLQQQMAGHNVLSAETIPALEVNSNPIVFVLLTPGLLRDGSTGAAGHVVPVPAVPATIRLALDLRRDDYRSYRVVIKTVEGKEIARIEGLKSRPLQNRGRAIAFDLASRLLSKGDYIATLSGLGPDEGQLPPVDFYSFSATR